MKILHAIMALLFLVTAVLQWNDPDPLYWVVAYGVVAAVAGAACLGRAWVTAARVAAGLCLAGLLMAAPGAGDFVAANDYGAITQGMSAEKPYIEPAREFGGLLLALAYLVFFEIIHRRGKSAPPEPTEEPRP